MTNNPAPFNKQREAKKELAKRELARRGLFNFIKYTFRSYKRESWHHKLISQYFEKVINKEILRLMVFAPPRHMKTESEERAISYAIGKDKDLKVICCAFGSDKASEISSHVKQNVKDELFTNVFTDHPQIGGLDRDNHWSLGGVHRAEVKAAGVGGPITGSGFNLGIIDDPVKSREEAESATYQEKTFEWYEGTFLNRQDEVDSAIILTNTRWNRKDLAGKILEREGIASYNGREPGEGCPEWNGQDDGKWHILCLPAEMDHEAYEWKHEDDPREIGDALWPERFPISFLNQFKANKYNWASLYQQRPKPKGGNLINREWFTLVDSMPPKANIVRFWDLASTPKQEKKKNDPDFTAGGLVGLHEGNLYIADVKASRNSPLNIEKMIKAQAEMDDFTYGRVKQYWEEEGGAGGKHITEHYKKLLISHFCSEYKVGKSKEFYIDLMANKAENGQIFLVKGKWINEVHDGNTFMDEAEEFPKGRHDDRIDAVAKACFILTGKPLTMLEALKKQR